MYRHTWEARCGLNTLVTTQGSLHNVEMATECSRPVRLEAGLYSAELPNGTIITIRRVSE